MAPTATATPHTVTPSAKEAIQTLDATRRGTLALVGGLGEEDLERVYSPIMSPLVWDLGHIAAYEDLWLAHRLWGLPLLRPDLADLYDAFETPRAVRGDIEILRAADARAYMQAVRTRTVEAIEREGIGDGVLYELVLRHELQHGETMRQTLAIAGLLAPPVHSVSESQAADGSQAWVQIPAGAFAMGAPAAGFAYDNERPRHSVEVSAFEIASRPVSGGSWMRFVEGGGYERSEWWSAEGWAWREELEVVPHPAVTSTDPASPVCHVTWFEADAFARAHDARLPTEAEWEKAATWSAGADGERDPSRGETAALSGVGVVWEWTQSFFGGYPGFVAYPYREYSEVFFGDTYRVLRGGSWATHPRVASATFRNWDLPQRRQIFAGLRLARSA